MKSSTPLFITALFLFFIAVKTPHADSKNGFKLTPSLIDIDSIYHGGPPKDGIPSLDDPVFYPAGSGSFLEPDDRVLGLVMNGVAKAYPIRILNWHEVVNDSFADTPVAVTYCPLCGTGAAFIARMDEIKLVFGVSGLLYNSDVLLYDRQSESLWSQIRAEAVTGEFIGLKLQTLPLIHTSWKKWKVQYPATLVLSEKTGFVRNYGRNPYQGYALTEQLYFPVANTSDAPLHPKETVLGVELNGGFKAYPFSRLKQYGKEQFNDSVGGAEVMIFWDEEGHSARAAAPEGKTVSFIQGFWFAWYAFYPQTELFALP